jgi:ACS family tartrate transporter-like MFS transporter
MHEDLEQAVSRKVATRLIPFLGLLYFAAFLDRVNVGFASLQMNRDLGISDEAYGLGAGIFFAGYCLFEVPSNLLLHRIGGRRWIARIMLTWGLISGATAFVHGPAGFAVLRFLLGVAEAGFFPGIIYYLTYWVPAARRARMIGAFMVAVPLSTAVGGPVSVAIMKLNGAAGMAGWQWLFVIEALPSLVLGVVTLFVLPDSPADARWLTAAERYWLERTLASEVTAQATDTLPSALRSLLDSRILSLSLCYFGVQIGFYGVILWLPQILRSIGIGVVSIGITVGGVYGLAALAMVRWARHSDRRGERPWHIAAAAAVACIGLVATAALAESAAVAIATITVGAVGTLAMLPIFWTLPSTLVRGVAAAAAIAFINSLGNVGGFVGPILIGWLKATTGGFSAGLVVAAIAVAASGVGALTVARAMRDGTRPVESSKVM